MWTTIGCLLLFGDMVCVIARLIHGSTGFLTPLFFLVAAAGAVMLAIGRKKEKGSVLLAPADIKTGLMRVQDLRRQADAGEISEWEYEHRKEEIMRNYGLTDVNKAEREREG